MVGVVVATVVGAGTTGTAAIPTTGTAAIPTTGTAAIPTVVEGASGFGSASNGLGIGYP